jgi:hypothetical protein
MNPIILEELAKTYQRDRLKEAERWREVSQGMGKKSDKMGMIRRIMTGVCKLAAAPSNIPSVYQTDGT